MTQFDNITQLPQAIDSHECDIEFSFPIFFTEKNVVVIVLCDTDTRQCCFLFGHSAEHSVLRILKNTKSSNSADNKPSTNDSIANIIEFNANTEHQINEYVRRRRSPWPSCESFVHFCVTLFACRYRRAHQRTCMHACMLSRRPMCVCVFRVSPRFHSINCFVFVSVYLPKHLL